MAAVAVVAAAVVAGGADNHALKKLNYRSVEMKSNLKDGIFAGLLCIVTTVAWIIGVPALSWSQQSGEAAASAPAGGGGKAFETPEEAADALIVAAEKFDVGVLHEIFGPGGDDIYLTGEYPQDRQRALDFASQAREKKSVSVDPKTRSRAFLIVGDEDWPFPVPIVRVNGKWYFDPKVGREELRYRRIGSNELDAIDICYGFVVAQYEYAYQPREGYNVNQFAQRIISTSGKQDGLGWQNLDGTWGGPVGQGIANAIEQGYSATAQPYHGYFYKVLKGQGPAAPLGEMNYVVEGAMIGGFALVAAPAEYGVTGLKTFMVSNDGIVYQKDYGRATLNEFIKIETFNPDPTWTPVADVAEER